MVIGSRYQNILQPEDVMWTPMGTTGQFQGISAIVEPRDSLKSQQAQALASEQALANKKFDLFSGLLKGYGSGGGIFGSSGFNFQGVHPPAPNYLSASPIWSQQQINAATNLQRSNLLQQANNQSRLFGNDMASRGFSPMSPFASFNNQNNLMKANAAAAANETTTNFNAAKDNKDAEIKQQAVNAGMYGDYVKSLMSAGQIQADAEYKNQSLRQEMLLAFLKGLM